MAGQDGAQTQALRLFELLEREPHRFDFFEAMRRLECAYPESPRFGRARRASDEPVRVGQEPSLAFAPRSIASFRGSQDAAPRLAVFFFGLFGPNGPLPLHLTEHARQRERSADDPAFARFADLFHHRLLMLFYRAWAASQPTVEFDREDDDFAGFLASLIGLGQPALRDRDAVPDLAKLHFAGLLAMGTRPAEALLRLVSGYFELPVEIEELTGGWVHLPTSAQTRVGERAALGVSTTVGERVRDPQRAFRIVMGPMGIDDYQRLLPGAPSRRRLVDLVRNIVGDEFEWDVRLVLLADDVPALVLGGETRLGWSTWLGAGPGTEDRGDLVLNPLADET